MRTGDGVDPAVQVQHGIVDNRITAYTLVSAKHHMNIILFPIRLDPLPHGQGPPVAHGIVGRHLVGQLPAFDVFRQVLIG